MNSDIMQAKANQSEMELEYQRLNNDIRRANEESRLARVSLNDLKH